MAKAIIIDDYITPIKKIITSNHPDKEEQLHRLIYRARKINNRHLHKHSVDQTVKKLLEPQWQTKIKDFDPTEWREAAELAWKKATKILGRVSPPEVVLFPGFNSSNGRIYRVGKKPIIGCSPDFPQSTGNNLMLIIVHEYAHFARWRKTGIPPENVPIYAQTYEEGWAVWFSAKILPDFNLSRIFGSNLHKAINLPDPKGGYLVWCRKNLGTIAIAAQKALKSRNREDSKCFFQGVRFKGDNTPIRTGYYLGYRLFEMLSERMTPRQLFQMKPTCKNMSAWLDELITTIT